MAWLTRAKTAMTRNHFPDPQEIETFDITQGKQLLQNIFSELKDNIIDLHTTPVRAGETADDKNNAYNTISLAAGALLEMIETSNSASEFLTKWKKLSGLKKLGYRAAAAGAKKFAAGDDVWVLTRLLPMVDRCAG